MRRQSNPRTPPRRPSTPDRIHQAQADAQSQLDSLRPFILPTLILIILTLAVYAPVANAGYIWDDDGYVTENPHLTDAGGLFDMWFRLGSTTMYVPAVFTILWVGYQLWGLAPAGYHVINVVLHVANVLLLWYLLRRLQLRGAWLAAALFAVHPVMVESVAWVVELKNVLSAFFSLLALLAYLRFSPLDGTPPPGARTRRVFYALALVLFTLALLSKPVVVAVAPVILILIWWKRGNIERSDVVSAAPFVALGLAASLVAIYIEHYYGGATGVAWESSLLERILVAGRASWFYAAKLAWPVNLLSIYPRWHISTDALWQYIFPVAAVAAIAALWHWRQRWGRGALAAVLCFAVLLSPLIGFFNVAYYLYSFVADHFQYHAAPALFAMFAAGIATVRATKGRTVARAVDGGTLVLLLVLVVLANRHAQTFHDEKTRCQATIEGNSRAWAAMYNLGLQLKAEGDPKAALHWYAEALKVTPHNPEVLNNAGVALMALGDGPQAVGYYREALRLAPGYALAHYNLAGALARLGDRESAIGEYSEALKIKPDYADAHKSLAKILAANGRVEDAVREFREALRITPRDAEAHHNLGVTLDGAGRYDDAIAEYREALRISPGDAATLRDLGASLAKQGKFADALSQYQEALRLEPNNAETHNGLAMVNAWSGQPDEATVEFQTALRLNPNYADAHNNFGTLLASQGRVQEAMAHFEQAVRLRPDSAEAHVNLGMALGSTGRLDAAVAEFQEAVRLDPRSAPVHERLGIAMAEMGRLDEAIAEFQRAIEINPDNPRARKNLDLALRLRTSGPAVTRGRRGS